MEDPGLPTPHPSFPNRMGTAAYVMVRIAILAAAAVFAVLMLMVGGFGENIEFASRIFSYAIGLAVLFVAYMNGKGIWSILKREREVPVLDKIAALPILAGMVFMAYYLYLCIPYFSKPYKQQQNAMSIIQEKIPYINDWDSVDINRKKSFLPILIALLEHENQPVRNRAAFYIGTIGYEAQKAVPALVKAMEQERSVPSSAANALAKLGVPGHAALQQALDHPDPLVRDAARFALK